MTVDIEALGPLPCPFCGAAPFVGSRASDCTKTGRWHWIGCYCGGYSSTAYRCGETAAEALRLWNTRAAVARAALEVTDG